MSPAQAQVLLAKTPKRDSLELGTVRLSSGQTAVVEKMHQVGVGEKTGSRAQAKGSQASWNTGLRVAVTSTHTSTGAVGLELKPEIIGEWLRVETSTGQTKPSVRQLSVVSSLERGQTALAASPPHEGDQEVTDEVPFLGNLPLIGRLFRTVTHSRTRDQVMLVATVRF
jgi:type II secretory pathway component GspD/PulD (secretin)